MGETATTARPLSEPERRAIVTALAKTATGRARRGIELIDFRPPTDREKAFAKTLAPAARRALRQ